MELCVYCGHNRLHLNGEDCYECSRCGLTYPRSDLNNFKISFLKDQRRNNAGPGSSASGEEAYRGEEETLDSVWPLMQAQAWDKALEALIPAELPCRHPLEFAVWRDICRTAPALTEKDLQRRELLIGFLRRNLICLHYFLPDSEDITNYREKYRTLQRLHQAVMLFGKLEVDCLTDYSWNSVITDTTNSDRVSALEVLAEFLEAQGADAACGTDYLKMSVQLYHQCLITAREYSNMSGRFGSFISMNTRQLQLSPKTRSRINAKILQLNESIARMDPDFIPQEKEPDPRIMPVWLSWVWITSVYYPAFLFPLALLLKDALNAWDLEFLLPGATDKEVMIEFGIVYYIIWTVGMIYVSKKYGCAS